MVMPGRARRSAAMCFRARLNSVLLSRAGFVRYHPPDGRLRVGEYRDPFRGYVPPRGCLQCVDKSSALRIVSLLVVSNVGFDARPG